MAEQTTAVAERERLGRHRGSYYPQEHKSHVVSLSVLTVVFALLTALGFAGGSVVLVVFAVLGTVALGIAAFHESYKVRHGVQLDLYEHGVIFIDRIGRVSAFRWDSMQVRQFITRHYQGGSYTSTTFSYRLTSHDGISVKVTASKAAAANPDEWGLAIQNAVTETQLPEALAQLRQGQPLLFGDLTLSWDMLVVGTKRLLWGQLEDVEIRNGRLFVKVAGRPRWLRLAKVSHVPNFFVCYALAKLRISGT